MLRLIQLLAIAINHRSHLIWTGSEINPYLLNVMVWYETSSSGGSYAADDWRAGTV